MLACRSRHFGYFGAQWHTLGSRCLSFVPAFLQTTDEPELAMNNDKMPFEWLWHNIPFLVSERKQVLFPPPTLPISTVPIPYQAVEIWVFKMRKGLIPYQLPCLLGSPLSIFSRQRSTWVHSIFRSKNRRGYSCLATRNFLTRFSLFSEENS
jgi:hypothetical protein